MIIRVLSRLTGLAFCIAGFLGAAGSVLAQSYPSKPIRFIVAFPAGGPQDVLARAIGQKITERWGQQVVIDNRPGANGIIGMEMTAKAVPDGYTVLMSYVGSIAINMSLYSKLPYDSVKDFSPIAPVASYPFIFVVHPSVPAKSVKELITLARSKPSQLNYGSGGSGTAGHLGMEMFKKMAGVSLVHVPYKGQAPATTDLLGGQVSMMFNNTVLALPHIKAGKLRALAVTGAKRSPAVPELPTISEAGVPGFEGSSGAGGLARAGSPSYIFGKFNAEIVRILGLPDIQARFASIGYEPTVDSPAHFAEYIKTEIVKWGNVVKDSGARVD